MTTDRPPAYPPRHAAIPLDGAVAPDEFIVSAILWMPATAAHDGRYLLQLRDDKPSLPLRDHWCLFGGHVEPGESAETALCREIEEEVGFHPREYRWYFEAISVLPRPHSRVVRKAFYLVPITAEDVAGMVQGEGADMRLFTLAEMLGLPRLSPWDLSVIMIHAREQAIFGP